MLTLSNTRFIIPSRSGALSHVFKVGVDLMCFDIISGGAIDDLCPFAVPFGADLIVMQRRRRPDTVRPILLRVDVSVVRVPDVCGPAWSLLRTALRATHSQSPL